MNQRAALAVGALAGAAAAFLLGRRRLESPSRTAPDTDLQARLAEAREADVDEAEFEAAGMAAETIVADEPDPSDPAPPNEFEAMRRRVHREARAAAEEMRRQAEPD